MRSRVFTRRPSPPAAELLAELAGYEIATLSDAGGGSLMDPGLRAVADVPRVAGTALTVSVAPGSFGAIPWALQLARSGDVLVVGGGGATARAVWGDYFSGWARELGVVAVVIDGATRDRRGIAASGFPVFARATTPCGPVRGGPSEVNVPIGCGGVSVHPGDVVVADDEGCIVLPLRTLDETVERVRAKAEGERTRPTPGGAEAYREYFDATFRDDAEVDVHDRCWDAREAP